jgi:rfaE bifunctional protein kinase chain/domain
MTTNWLEECLHRLKTARIAILGEFCLDAYWFISDDNSEVSVETGLSVRRVQTQRYSLGGAANVAANLRALGIAQISAIGVIGRDPFGEMLFSLLADIQTDVAGIVRDQSDWQTCVYAKPCVNDIEQNRVDFGAFNQPAGSTIEQLVESINRAAETHDLLIVNQQIPNGLFQMPLIEAVNRLAIDWPKFKIIVDSRHFAADFRNVSLKINASEACRIASGAASASFSAAKVRQTARELYERVNRPVFITCGERGIVAASESEIEEIPGILVPPPIDIVGAGDTALASIAAVLAGCYSGENPSNAARFANIAASISLKKLHVTGTASPTEILSVGPDPDYIYLPELAIDDRAAVYVEDSEIEIVRQLPPNLKIEHAIFDHDGTLSTLREGWEKIMEPMMVRAILGDGFRATDEDLLLRVTRECRDFIDRTTGAQTLVQMSGLVDLVRQFGCVQESKILDSYGYKKIYNDQLLNMVKRRLQKLSTGELQPEDFQMKNAIGLLGALRQKGVTLYLASGTDVEDVILEARALGYGDFFGNRIFGAVGDITIEAKKLVLERIMHENNLSGSNLVTFGDGPVEIRETRKRGGVAVGVASDEVRRFGVNLAKRKRLIRSGADVIVPDYSQLPQLLSILHLG